MLVVPPIITSLILFVLLAQSRNAVQGAGYLTLALSFALLSLGVFMLLRDPQLMTRPFRAVVAAVLVTPWASFGLALFWQIFHAPRPALLTLDFFFATFLIAVCIAGFRMLVWPLPRAPIGWRPPLSDPPLGGAGVPARLKPRPPVLIASEAKEIPRDDESNGRDLSNA
jgi:hypothetical protein